MVWIKDKEKIFAAYESGKVNPKRRSWQKAVFTWFENCRANETFRFLPQFAETLNLPDFKASDGWKSKNNVLPKTLTMLLFLHLRAKFMLLLIFCKHSVFIMTHLVVGEQMRSLMNSFARLYDVSARKKGKRQPLLSHVYIFNIAVNFAFKVDREKIEVNFESKLKV